VRFVAQAHDEAEIDGSSRSIFGFAAWYASSTASLSLGGPSAKNGCCLSAVSEA